ncbi:E3 ubiquitin-protein ligase BRE1 [Nakaseomyces bracarensis]|uniref:E3 ubiquitin protein ligase n=1 Tax=Nakaseomyces bracarensis TaxID=273131 RepID=A0ABR4NNQ6_9SACH
MSSEPAAKRIKLELSDPEEPLTQTDVIAFQKEALFRCLNSKRTELEALKEQYQSVEKNYDEISRNMAATIAICTTSATHLQQLCQDPSDKKICEEIANGDEKAILKLSSQFLEILYKYCSNTEVKAEHSELFSHELKKLNAIKQELRLENNKLKNELDSIKRYYDDLIKKYDREDSLTVKRVFSKEKTEEESEQSEIQSEAPTSVTEVKPALKQEPNGESVSNGTKPASDEESISESEKKKLVFKYESDISDLQSQLKTMKTMVEELEKLKTINESELVQLRNTMSKMVSDELAKHEEKNGLIQQLDKLKTTNRELTAVNDAFLAKFQTLAREKDVFIEKVSADVESALENLKEQNLNLEKDLVRVRTTRDELLSKISILEAETSKSTMISDLQRALGICKEQWDKIELRHNDVPNQDALMKEIGDLESGFKELSNLVHTKYTEYLNHESVISKLTIEKTKADQKYFASMRSKDSILVENKNLSKSLTKSNELILQLKDSDKLYKQKIENLHKQLTLSQNNEKRLLDSNKATNLKMMELNSEVVKQKKLLESIENEKSSLIKNVTETEGVIKEKDIEIASVKNDIENITKKYRKLEQLLYEDNKGKLGKARSGSPPLLNSDDAMAEELENFRTLVYCSLCSRNWKNMAIKTCGHVFCEDCCKERLAARMRKCPTCNKPFSSNDLLTVHL